MKLIRLSMVAAGAIILLSGCASTDPAAEQKQKQKEMAKKIKDIKANLQKISSKDESDAKKFAQTQADNYFKALKDKDYAAFCKGKKLSKANFNKWYKALNTIYGKLESQSYVGVVSNPMIIRYMWKWNFSKTGKNGKTFKRQALYNVYVVKDKKTNKYILYTSGLQ